MTLHEVLVSTAWVVVVGYLIYLAWFVRAELRLAMQRREERARRMHPSSRASKRLPSTLDS